MRRAVSIAAGISARLRCPVTWGGGRGVIFVGIDVIGDYLTEINVTSPTGIQEINRLDNIHIEKQLWDAIETRLAQRRDLCPL